MIMPNFQHRLNFRYIVIYKEIFGNEALNLILIAVMG
jgi:hypothetical protein